MVVLPNGLKVFNATPHPITFWREDWASVVEVPVDTIISASSKEEPAGCYQAFAAPDWESVWFFRTTFAGNDDGRAIIAAAKADGAEVIIGSITAAQAYPGDVVAMVPCVGYERVPPNEKRMRPDKFTIF